MNRELVILGGASLASLAVGTAVGYFVAVKRAELKYAELAEMEIAQARKYYNDLAKDSLIPSEGPDLHEKAVAAMNKYKGVETLDSEPAPVIQKNVFDEPEDDEAEVLNKMLELSPRVENSDDPYIITQEEFFLNDAGYEQLSMAYFAGDDVLADDRDQPVEDTDAVVGDNHLELFGLGSKDNKIVYVRNPRLENDFEIVRSEGTYTREVMGFIEHSDYSSRPRRFRGDDE